MAIRIPIAEKRDLSDDPWITLGEAVRWAAWRGQPEPHYGFTEFDDGTWIDGGDMDESDRLVYRDGAEAVRKALAAGRLEAWAQTGYEEPTILPQARWSGQMLGSIVSWVEFYHPFDRIIVERERVVREFPPNAEPTADAPAEDRLSLWLALELRRARAAFDKTRKAQDADFEAKGMRKTGVRVKLTLNSASAICVALADNTIAKAAEYRSSPTAIASARAKVEAFTKEVANSAIPLAFFVSGETGLGGSVVKIARERGQQLCDDVAGAFALAADESAKARDPSSDSPAEALLRLWSADAKRQFEAQRTVALDELILAGRSASGYYSVGLRDATSVVIAMLEKARAAPIPSTGYEAALWSAKDLFDALVKDVRNVAFGPASVVPTLAKTADRAVDEGRKIIENKVAEWKLQDQIAATGVKATDEQSSSLSQVVKRRGRLPGSGSMATADAPLLAEMRQLIADGIAYSPDGAAKLVAAKAAGASLESNATRLAKRYRTSEPNSLA